MKNNYLLINYLSCQYLSIKEFVEKYGLKKRNKSLIVYDQTINGEGLGDFFKYLGSATKNVGKKILNNPGRALEIAANIGTVAAIRESKIHCCNCRRRY